MNYLLGIDLGSTNIKAILYDENGIGTAQSSVGTPVFVNEAGLSVLDPEKIWSIICGLIKDVVLQLEDKNGKNASKDIAGIACTSIAESGVLLDKKGEPAFPIIMWYDPCTMGMERYWNDEFDKKRLVDITGQRAQHNYSLNKIRWIKEHYPEAYEKTQIFMCMADYISYKLTGRAVMNYSLACRTMMFDIREKKWSEKICDTAGISLGILPPLVPSGISLGKVLPDAAKACGLTEQTEVFSGGHDHICGALAAGILDSESLLDSSGTAEQFLSVPDDFSAFKPLALEGFNMGLHTADGLYYAAGAMTSSGRTADWFAKEIGAGYDTSSSEAGAKGISFLPHLAGGSSPARDMHDYGAFTGLRAHHTKADMMQAVYEGLCFELKLGIERLFSSKPSRIVVTGGGTRNEKWMQTKANILGKELTVPKEYQSTAMGAALLAGIGAGIYKDAHDAYKKTFSIEKIYSPIDSFDYTVSFERYRKVNAALNEIYSQY